MASAQPSHEIDLDVSQLVLDVSNRKLRGFDARIDGSLTDGQLERTIEGASTLTLTVHDPKRTLLRSPLFDYAIDVRLDKLFFRLVKVSKADDDLTLTFEDREVAYLRQDSAPKKAGRTNLTRAEFALSLVREVKESGGITFVCPELHVTQPTLSGGKIDRTQTKKLPYQFRRGTADGTRENSWTCLQRLASEVQWRCFMSAGACWFISETQLLKAPPRLILSETSQGVLQIDFDLDSGKPVNEVTLTARASRWVAAPGAVVQLTDCGPANGNWIVAKINRDLFDPTTTVNLRRALKPLAEPAPESASLSTMTSKAARVSGSQGRLGGSQADRALAAASSIDRQHLPYVWGGGHAHCGTPDGGTGRDPGVGYDCSGSTCAVLAAAGMGFTLGGPAAVSGTLESWGDPGEGARITVYASAVHVWMTIDGQHFGTGDWGKGWGGPGFNPNMHPTAGFTVRHWPGT